MKLELPGLPDVFIPLSKGNRPSLFKEPRVRWELFKRRVTYKVKNLVRYIDTYFQTFFFLNPRTIVFFFSISSNPPRMERELIAET